MANQEQTAEYINVKETARRAGLSASFFNKARLTGDGPAYIRAGAAIRYHWPTVEAWLQSRMRRSTSEQVAA